MEQPRPLRRILCVDDEPDIQMLTEFSLKNVGGFEVKLASSGAEALRVAEAFAPDLILLDIMMPEMDGPALLAELKRRPGTAAIPALFMTAMAREGDLDRLRGLGAVDVVVKPFDPLALPGRLRDTWERIHGRS